MGQRSVSALVLSLWLLLVGIELAEEFGFFNFDDPGLAQTMDGIVDSFGQSTPIDDHSSESIFPVVSFVMIDPHVREASVFETLVQQPASSIKRRLRIFNLQRVFLI